MTGDNKVASRTCLLQTHYYYTYGKQVLSSRWVSGSNPVLRNTQCPRCTCMAILDLHQEAGVSMHHVDNKKCCSRAPWSLFFKFLMQLRRTPSGGKFSKVENKSCRGNINGPVVGNDAGAEFVQKARTSQDSACVLTTLEISLTTMQQNNIPA